MIGVAESESFDQKSELISIYVHRALDPLISIRKGFRKDLRYNTKRKERTKSRSKQFHFFSKHPTKYNKEKYQKSRHLNYYLMNAF